MVLRFLIFSLTNPASRVIATIHIGQSIAVLFASLLCIWLFLQSAYMSLPFDTLLSIQLSIVCVCVCVCVCVFNVM